MKKNFFYFICLILLIIGCNSLDLSQSVSISSSLSKTRSGSSIEAEQIAISAVLEMVHTIDKNTKRGDERRIATAQYVDKLSDPNEGEVLSSPVYIINFQDNAGFAIAAGDSKLPPVLCVVDSGHFHIGDELPLGAIAMLSSLDVGNYDETRDSMIDPWNCFPSDRYLVNWETISYGNTHGTQIDCRWGQKPRFNYLCPLIDGNRALVGCVPVAVGQIMYYYGKNTEYDGYTYNWSVLNNVVDTSSCPMYAGAWYGVANLLKTLGNPENLNAEYGVDSTSAKTSYAPRSFENFGYQNGGTYSDYSFWTLSYEIVHNHPVLLSARRSMKTTTYPNGHVDTSYYKGHAWVADQFLTAIGRVTVFDKDNNGEIVYRDTLTRHFIHCNWGWNGEYNGFFLSGQFKYKYPYSFPQRTQIDSFTGSEYKYLLKQVTGIRP